MASYRDAIEWVAMNDDTEFIEGDAQYGGGSGYTLSVTASLIRDLWYKTDEQVLIDLKRAIKRLSK